MYKNKNNPYQLYNKRIYTKNKQQQQQQNTKKGGKKKKKD